MDRMGKAGRFLAKPRQGPLAARSVSRHKNDPGAHFRELFGSNLSDAGGVSRLPLHETLPRHMALYRSVRARRLPILQQRATVWRKPIDAGFAHGAGARDPRVGDERRAGELLPYIVDRWIEGLP